MSIDKSTVWAQMSLSVLYTVGFFAVVLLFTLGYARIPAESKDIFSGFMSILSAAQLAIIYFWFQRTRTQQQPPSAGEPEAGGGNNVP